MIPYGRQFIDDEDIAAVVAVLHDDFLTQGPRVPEFENVLAARCQARHGVAFSSATAALHIACLALDLGPGDWVWTTPITFVASANCALYCGAKVDFVDIDPVTYNLCPDALETKLQLAEAEGRLPKVVIPVHFAGQSCDMRRIAELAQRYGFRVIEDASHAVGADYDDGPVGDCRFSDITVFSFHPVKIMTTAEGGMALTNSAQLADRLALLRSHGVTRDPAKLGRGQDESWYYEQQALGFNYRITELQAALGLSQAAKLDRFVARRRALAAVYDEALVHDHLVLPAQAPFGRSSYHLYVIRLQEGAPLSRLAFYDALRDAGLGVNVHYIPVYHQPYYRQLGFDEGYCLEAERYYRSALTIPLFAAMTDDEQSQVIDSVLLALGA